MELNEKVILVTGASSGIGQATAIEAAKEGCIVLFTYYTNEKGAKETLTEIEKYSKGKYYHIDLSDQSKVIELFQSISREFTSIDILINNAGKANSGSVADINLWHEQFDVNLYSALYSIIEFIKFKNPSRIRKIINISSVYGIGHMTNPSFPQYGAAKSALSHLSMSLAKQYAPDILVNTIAPGYVWTPPWEGISQEEHDEVERLNKIGRFVTPEEIAQTIMNTLKNDSVTGELIRVDGGLHLMELV